jgi:EmrB/QacA subfamily drug resistance transporter
MRRGEEVRVIQTSSSNGAVARVPASVVAPSPLTWPDCARLLVILVGAFMVVLDFFIVLVALPPIAADLAATPGQLQLIVAGYGIANAAGLIAGGKLGDLFGRRRMFMVGLALFGVASVACGLSTTGLALVLSRFAQGATGALLHPQVLALLGLNFPGDKRARAFAAYAMAMGLAGVAGQLLGGALIELNFAQTGWRACFFINAPIALAAIAIGWQLLDRETPPAAAQGVDVWGMTLTAAALSCLIVPLTYGREALSLTANVALLASAAALAIVFALSQQRRAAAGLAVMVAPALVDARHFRLGVATIAVFYSGVASFYFVLGLHLQSTLGLSPLQSGAVFALLGAAFFAASMASAPLGRVLKRPPVEAGALVLAAGHLLQLGAAAGGGGVPTMLLPLLVEGAGIGLVMAPLVSLALSRLPSQHAGVAAGILSTMQSSGNALGVAVVGVCYLAGAWLPALPAGPHMRFAEALALLAVLALAVWHLARRIRGTADGTA